MATPSVDDLLSAVETILDPNTDANSRQLAHQVYEAFKERTDAVVCISTGSQIFFSKAIPATGRFLGIQLLHDCIRHRWGELLDSTTSLLRLQAVDILAEVSQCEEAFLWHGASVLVVELMKKTWPQCWEDLDTQLIALCDTNVLCLEPVLLVYERLAQDVLLDGDGHLKPTRRQELKLALSRYCRLGLVDFLVAQLLTHSAPECAMEINWASPAQEPVRIRIAARVLVTLATYLEWCPLKSVLAGAVPLMEALCKLVANPALQSGAVECLIVLVEKRSGTQPDRDAILVLLQPSALQLFLDAVKASSSCTSAPSASDAYDFLRRLTTLIFDLGSYLVLSPWGTTDKPGLGEPVSLAAYLDILLLLLNHDSLCVCNQAAVLQVSFLEHELAKQSAAVKQRLAAMLERSVKLLVRPCNIIGGQTLRQHYLALDFLDEKEFAKFFGILRGHCIDVIRLLTPRIPSMVAQLSSGSVLRLVQSAAGQEMAKVSGSSQFALECDAVQCLVEVQASALAKLPNSQWPSAALLIQPLEALLQWNCQDVHLLRMQLSMVDSSRVYLGFAPELLRNVLEKVFAALAFEPPTKLDYSELLAMKTKAAMSFIHVCAAHAQTISQLNLLQPIFGMVVKQWPQHGTTARQLLCEGLICASRSLPTFEERQMAAAQVLQPVAEVWQDSEVQTALSAAGAFSQCYELVASVSGAKCTGDCISRRKQLRFAVNSLAAVSRRSSVDATTAHASTCSSSADVAQSLVNPAWESVQRLLPHVLCLLRTLNDFSAPAAGGSDLCRQSQVAFDLPLLDKATIVGIDTSDPDFKQSAREDPISNAQKFILTVYDGSFAAIGTCASIFGDSFYGLPNLLENLKDSVFRNIQHAPIAYLRLFIRSCLKPLVINCPLQCFSTFLEPVLLWFFTLMTEILNATWAKMAKSSDILPGPSGQEDMAEQMERLNQAELVEDCLARHLHKDFSALIDKMFPLPLPVTKAAVDVGGGVVDVSMDGESATTRSADRLSRHILSTTAVCQPLLAILLSSLYCPDSQMAKRCTCILDVILPQLAGQWLQDAASCQQILGPILQGLNVHGQHEGNESQLLQLLCTVYPLMLQSHKANVHSLLCRLLNATEQSVYALEQVFSAEGKAKQRRDCWRKVLGGIVGTSTSQKHIRKVAESYLPRIPVAGSKSLAEAEATLHADNILLLPDLGLTSLFQPG